MKTSYKKKLEKCQKIMKRFNIKILTEEQTFLSNQEYKKLYFDCIEKIKKIDAGIIGLYDL